MKKLNIFLFGLILLPLISANGLQVQPTTIEINKTNNIDYSFNLNLSNEEPFDFFNITTTNNILEFNKFTLLSGETKEINITIKSNNEFDGDIKFIGDFWANLGQQNETQIITIDSNGFDICNLDMIEGDTIIWNSTLLGEAKLKNLNTNQYFSTIPAEGTYEETFDTPLEFDYQLYRIGLPFSNICHINIQPTEGYVHSQDYDITFKLDLNIEFEPTTIETTILTNSYNLSYNSQKEDIFSIRNSGVKVAKIKLSGEWFNFTEDNFDLEVGESKNIGFTISPIILDTEDTGKTYIKKLRIEGNFQTIEEDFEINIKYKDLSNLFNNFSIDNEAIKSLLNLFCLQNPDDCPRTIIPSNEINKNVTFQVNEETWRDFLETFVKSQEESIKSSKTTNEHLSTLDNRTLGFEKNFNTSKIESKEVRNEIDDFLNAQTLIYSSIFAVVIIIGLLYILKNDNIKIQLNKFLHKGELAP